MNDVAPGETTAKPAATPKSSSRAAKAPAVKTINLALQGGGAHGAFTWGVLDRLLEEEGLAFEGVSATSAGAMNAAVLAYGITIGGREGARKALTNYWRRISHAAQSSPLQPSPIDRALKDHSLRWSPAFLFFDIMTRMMSPYEFNPMNLNPLREVVQQSVDFTVLNKPECPVKLYLSATNVRTGKVKIFEQGELSVDAALASACLPFMFQAVEIDGEAYWDGGYMGNPALYPLIYSCASQDVLIVHINPLERKDIPKTATEILNRINEISFNSSLMREMRAISFVTKLIDEKLLDAKHVFIHGISDDPMMTGLGVASKLNADWEFLCILRDDGRKRADEWLAQNFAKVGSQSTVDIHTKFL
ncbi:MAG TPA: patatin-like phospholipase family protein [Stellaceae bacterium]|nr:patatin-like phospholipase family protein [Stellaceae bacterium]